MDILEGLEVVRLEALPGDASARRYWRAELAGGQRRIVMAVPPSERASLRSFVAVAAYLKGCHLRAPEVLREGEDLLLLEDFGDGTFGRLLTENPGREEELYTLATRALVALHSREHPTLPCADYGMDALRTEVDLLPQWYLGLAADTEAMAAWGEAWNEALGHLPPRVGRWGATLVLRDYHVDNLMLVEGAGLQACGLLDFQDARRGWAAYDVLSLLEDARRDVTPEVRTRMLALYCAESGCSRDEFMLGYEILAAQRHGKVLGIFTRLAHRDGKAQYQRHLPRVRRLWEESLSRAPVLGAVRRWWQRFGGEG